MNSSVKEIGGSREAASQEAGSEWLGFDGVVLQDKNNNCGPAALKMVLDRRGIKSSLGELERRVRLTRKGWSLQAVKKAAESYGLHADGWRLKPEELLREPFPVILHTKSNHFVVVDSSDAFGFLFVRDPSVGRIKIPRHKLTSFWTGEALVFGDNPLTNNQQHMK
jgi:ABC-type bacteriocin/lantibiotic exporter with double-glycine peptidase domain